jgi:hypothetical protein
MYLKATIQKVTDFGYFAENKRLSNRIGILAPQTFFSYYYSIYIFFIPPFYLRWLWHGWQNL